MPTKKAETTRQKTWPIAPAAAMAARDPVSWRLSPDGAALEPPACKLEPVDSPEQSCEAHQGPRPWEEQACGRHRLPLATARGPYKSLALLALL